MGVKENLQAIRATVPEGVTLIAVSKQKPQEQIIEAYNIGQRIFAENRHKELIEKYEALPKDIEWHYIGTLQRTNVKFVVPYATLIHSVDSQKLLESINKESAKIGKISDLLLEIFIAEDETKSGWSTPELEAYLATGSHKELKNINIRGVMAMATYTNDENKIRREFKELKRIFDHLKNNFFAANTSFNTISEGMSSDYQIAIEEGSTMVRVGSNIFK